MSRLLAFAVFMSLLSLGCSAFAAELLFAIAVTDTPVLNTPDFRAVFGGNDGKTLKKDQCGQLRSLEFVALPGTAFRIEEQLRIDGRLILRVSTADYPYPTENGYFVDASFIRMQAEKPGERAVYLPAKDAVIAALKKMTGSSYVWGGNNSAGVSPLISWYPPAAGSKLSQGDKALWTLTGVDCSGLLYEATAGYTPRNTSALINFGTSVPIAGKSIKEIAAQLQPLDLIVWPGHVLIVIDGGNIIESRLVCKEPARGVRIRPVIKALTDIMKGRKPADIISNSTAEFVVRRWYGIQPAVFHSAP